MNSSVLKRMTLSLIPVFLAAALLMVTVSIVRGQALISSREVQSAAEQPGALDITNEPRLTAQNPGEAFWYGQYYNNADLFGEPALERIDSTIDFDWGAGSPDPVIVVDNFSVRWTGTITPPAGTYLFDMGSDDGSRLWIDDVLIMDHWDEWGQHWQATVPLMEGPHQVKMEMHELAGVAWAELTWQLITIPPTLEPAWQGSLAPAGTTVFYTQTLTSNSISDSFDLSASGNSWPTTFWDGPTQISNTGTLAYLETFTFTVRVEVPDDVAGIEDIATIRSTSVSSPVLSSTASLQTAVLTFPWVQAFGEDWAPDGSPDQEQYLDIVGPEGIDTVQVTDDLDWPFSPPAVAAYPREVIVTAWASDGYYNDTAEYNNIEYAAFDAEGSTVVSVTQVSDNISVTFNTYDYEPAPAVSPVDGNVLITWYRNEYDEMNNRLYNIYYAIRSPDGSEVLSPTALTTNITSTMRDSTPSVAAFGNGHFAVTWENYESISFIYNVYYAVLDSAGGLVAGPVNLTSNSGGEYIWYPTANRLDDGNVLLTWSQLGISSLDIYYAVLDSAGNVIHPITQLVDAFSGAYQPDAVGLRNGNSVIAWRQYGYYPYWGTQIVYAMLDGDYEPLWAPQNPGEVAWNARYYNNETLTEPAALVRIDSTIDFDWGTGSPDPSINADYFSVRWTGTITLPVAGDYHFIMGSDDGSRLWIDGELIMDHWDEWGEYWIAVVPLTDGPHQVKMEMNELVGDAWAELTWRPILYNMYANNNEYVSLARDGADNAVFTWQGSDDDIYYGLVDNAGELRTRPIVFHTQRTWLDINQQGAGNGSLPEPALSITKTTSPEPVAPGDLLTYTITVENSGYAKATGVTITDTLPTNTTFISADAGGVLVDDQVQWSDLTVNAGESWVVQFVVQVSETLPDGSTIVNDDYGVKFAELATIVMGEAVTTPVNIEEWLVYLPLIQ
jgi:uncharacterized repeat protein (TIGR01451 family)